MKQIDFEIEEEIGAISTSRSGWTKELNIISWNGNEPKYDIRSWDPERNKCSKGITLTEEEAAVLYDLLGETLGVEEGMD